MPQRLTRRRSISERLDELSDELLADGEPHPPRERAELSYGPVATRTHIALVDLMDRILDLGQRYSSDSPELESAAGGGVMLRTTVRSIRKLRPFILEQLAKVPEDEVKAFMATLVAQITEAITTPEDDDGPGSDQPASATAGVAGGRDPGREIDAR